MTNEKKLEIISKGKNPPEYIQIEYTRNNVRYIQYYHMGEDGRYWYYDKISNIDIADEATPILTEVYRQYKEEEND